MKEAFKEIVSKLNVLQFIIVNTMLIAFIISVYTLLFKIIPVENKDAVMILIGMITGSVKTMIDYHYGSSKSSQRKSDTIDSMIKEDTESKQTL